MKTISQDKVQFASGMTKNKRTGRNVGSLEEGLRVMSECGCGLDCKCLGALILPVHDTVNGGIIDFAAIYLTSADGGTTITVNQEMVADAETTIAGFQP